MALIELVSASQHVHAIPFGRRTTSFKEIIYSCFYHFPINLQHTSKFCQIVYFSCPDRVVFIYARGPGKGYLSANVSNQAEGKSWLNMLKLWAFYLFLKVFVWLQWPASWLRFFTPLRREAPPGHQATINWVINIHLKCSPRCLQRASLIFAAERKLDTLRLTQWRGLENKITLHAKQRELIVCSLKSILNPFLIL